MNEKPKLVCVNCKAAHATVDCPELALVGEPDLKLADTHLDLAEIALAAAWTDGRAVNIVIGHLEEAIAALRPDFKKLHSIPAVKCQEL